MTEVELVSLREYARRRGVSLMAVQKAIKSGRIQTVLNAQGQPKIDPLLANEQWEANTDKALQRDRPVKAAEPELVPEDEELDPLPQQPTARAAPAKPGLTYANSRAITEAYKAKMARLDYEKAIGKMVESDKIKLEAFQAARVTRDALLNIPNKIAHELAAETDANKIHILLTEVISQALEELVAEGQRRMAAREAEIKK